VITAEALNDMQRLVDEVFVHNAVLDYAVQLVHATRVPDQYGLPHVAARVAYGASPRASLGLVAAGRALALLRGRNYVLPQDVVAVAREVMAHRLVLAFDAIADGVDPRAVVERVVSAIPQPHPVWNTGPVPEFR
jgi:MoxR-like ATPase